MTKNVYFVLSITCIFLLLPGNVCLAQRAAERQAPAEVQQFNLHELRNIGKMIARGEPQEKYLAVWKQLVSKSRNMDIHGAIDLIMDEAQQEANRNVDQLRSKVQKYNAIKRNISQEIGDVRLMLNRSTGRIQSIQEKIYVIERRTPDKFIVQKGKIINKRSELENYINYLQRNLNLLEDDAQLANTDLQQVYQNLQQLVAMLSKIARDIEDSTMAILKNMH
jgi:chromosome segregation ATPase